MWNHTNFGRLTSILHLHKKCIKEHTKDSNLLVIELTVNKLVLDNSIFIIH